ncbi:MAG: EpsG family protein [Butyrivibrio sp.]|nr:EpsG family protein [Acetatifactor muris]MCM1558989.1 EpsG family protein [Butyrivibrio sp.]
MILYLSVTALTVLMAYFINSAYAGKQNNGMAGKTAKSRQELLNTVLLAGIFAVLFALSALRIGIGNDYWVYRYNFLHIISGDTKVSYEVGFKALVKVLQGLFGYDNYRIVFAAMAFLTCFFFIKGLFDNADWFAMSFFLFMANGFYFMSFSNVRYYFVLAVCAYAMKFLFERDFVRFVFWIVIAAFFHKSVLLVIPVYIIAYYLKWNKKTVWLIPAVCAALVAGKAVITRLMFVFYPYYEGDLFLDVESISYANIAKCLAVLILSLIYYKKGIKGNQKAETLFNLNLFALIIYSFGYYILETSRICYYMVLGHVFLIPVVLEAIENKRQKRFFMGAVILAYTAYLVIFLLKGREPAVLILPYMTWLFT